jgi:hypothetical protein
MYFIILYLGVLTTKVTEIITGCSVALDVAFLDGVVHNLYSVIFKRSDSI